MTFNIVSNLLRKVQLLHLMHLLRGGELFVLCLYVNLHVEVVQAFDEFFEDFQEFSVDVLEKLIEVSSAPLVTYADMGSLCQELLEPTSDASNSLKERDVIVSFDGVRIGQKFAGDIAEVGIIRSGTFMKVQVVLDPCVNLVPYHIEGDSPSYFIVAGLVFTPEPLIDSIYDTYDALKATYYDVAKQYKGKGVSFFMGDVGAGERMFEILSFVDDYKNEKLQPYWKSEPIPEVNDGLIKVVVCDNVQDIVFNSGKNVLLEFTSSRSLKRDKFGSILEEIDASF
ncbi:hypothetical protein LIER_02700 [Lithospermum erythrorhizon]|uniref:protein disulfide-isomerase n=1 Tax=Lithospermum erythrorhizon TaxID=34254 RepID=A0AAV3NQD3_LITER